MEAARPRLTCTSGDQLGFAAVAQLAGQGRESGVEATNLLDGGPGKADPGEDVEHADRRALDSGVLGGDLRQRMREHNKGRLPKSAPDGARRPSKPAAWAPAAQASVPLSPGNDEGPPGSGP
jgi:hypothetical protein